MTGSLTRELSSLVEDGAEGDGRGLHGGEVYREVSFWVWQSRRPSNRGHDGGSTVPKGAKCGDFHLGKRRPTVQLTVKRHFW